MTAITPLHVWSGYSIGRGSVTPQGLIERAVELGHGSLVLTDVNNLGGATVFYRQARQAGLHPIVGAELRDEAGASAVALVIDEAGYENLCQLITQRMPTTTRGANRPSNVPAAKRPPSTCPSGCRPWPMGCTW